MTRLGSLTFALPFALASVNVRQRQHWAELHREQQRISQEVMVAIGGPRYYPRPPWDYVRVTVVRCSAGRLDRDNLAGSVKPLLDALCMRCPRHPTGLGIIVDDSDDRLALTVKQASAAVGAGSTVVRVQQLEGPPSHDNRP